LGSAQLTVGDIAHFQPALVAADPASGLIAFTVGDIVHFGLAVIAADPAIG
jgi:hypothetical protein